MNFNNFEFANFKYVLPLFVITCLLIFCIMRIYFWKKNITNVLGRSLLLNFSIYKFNLKFVLSILGVILLFIALLRPRWGELKNDEVIQVGRNLLIALDVSRSMLAQDISPDRLGFAKLKIKNLVDNLKTDRVGLIPFSNDAFVLCPLTNDFGAFFMYLDSIDKNTLSEGSTDLGKAILKAISVFSSDTNATTKILVLFTDGEDFSTDLSSIKQKAQTIGLKVFTVGIGTDNGAPVPIISRDGSVVDYEKEADGSIVITKLNQKLLSELSAASGATYIKSTNDNSDIKSLISKIELFEKNKFNNKIISKAPERYFYFAIGSFLFFLLEWLL